VSTPYELGAAPSVPGSFLQSGEVFLQERFVLTVLYVQLRACPVWVYGRAFLDFRKMFSATKKAAELRSTGNAGTDETFSVSKNCCAHKMGNIPSVPGFFVADFGTLKSAIMPRSKRSRASGLFPCIQVSS